MTLDTCAVAGWGLTCSTEKGTIFPIFPKRLVMANEDDSKREYIQAWDVLELITN